VDNDLHKDAGNLAGQVETSATDLADGAKTQMGEMVGKATVAAQDAYGHVRDQARDAGTAVASTVVQQPLLALLVTGLVCGVAGYLFARR